MAPSDKNPDQQSPAQTSAESHVRQTPWRFVKRDGSTNIDASSFRQGYWSDLYHVLLSEPWSRLLLLVFVGYILLNLVFGTAYYAGGPGTLEGISAEGGMGRWEACFFFSVQTLATIGYGKISPVSLFSHLLVTLEALIGLVSLALVTGIVFARFSRPTARVQFSDTALMTRIDGKPSLMFRMANARLNQIVEAQVRVVLSRFEKTVEGQSYRELYDLKLDRDRSPIFAMSWTLIHIIEPDSPLYGQTLESLFDSETEIIVTVTGTDETFSQTVHARFSYGPQEIAWNRTFEDVLSRTHEGKIHVAIDLLSATRPANPAETVGSRLQ